MQTLASGLEVTPVGHSFKLLDSREGQRRWLVQLPKPAPMTEFQLPHDTDNNSQVQDEAAADEAEPETGLRDLVDPSMEAREAIDGAQSSRCSYAMANLDLDEVRNAHPMHFERTDLLGMCVLLTCYYSCIQMNRQA